MLHHLSFIDITNLLQRSYIRSVSPRWRCKPLPGTGKNGLRHSGGILWRFAANGSSYCCVGL